MVFRLIQGGVRENLCLIPVIHEWKMRNTTEDLFLETAMPELFSANKDLTGIGTWFDVEALIDFDLMNDVGFDAHLIDLFAMTAFGDNRLLSRRMDLGFKTPAQGKNQVYIGEICAKKHPEIFQQVQCQHQTSIVKYDPDEVETLFGMMASGKAFVGCWEDMTWLAMTTDIPIVMLSGPHLPKKIRPFREGRPFEAVASKCEYMKDCVRHYSSSGFGFMYHVWCRNENPMICESVSGDEVLVALNRVLALQ